MGNIILVAESGADIPPELAQRYGIQIVPMHVSFGSVTQDDGTFPSDDICAYYERTGHLPKTSASTPEDFNAAFDRIHTQWPEAQILYLAYSAVTTCSYQSAQIAAEGRDYVTSVDTKAVTAGQQSIVIHVARLLEAHPDWELSQAVTAAEELIDRSRMCFIPKDMKYLRARGRVSNAVALCGDLLGIHPLIEIKDGFIKDAAILEYGKTLVFGCFCTAPIYGLFQLSVNFLQATERPFWSTALTLLRQGIIIIPAMLLLNYVAGFQGLAFCFAVTDVFAAGIGLILIQKRMKELKCVPLQ